MWTLRPVGKDRIKLHGVQILFKELESKTEREREKDWQSWQFP